MQQLLCIYHVIVRVLEYSACTWACCTKGDSESLERLQRRDARIVTKINSSDSTLVKLNWETLNDMRNFQTCSKMSQNAAKVSLYK